MTFEEEKGAAFSGREANSSLFVGRRGAEGGPRPAPLLFILRARPAAPQRSHVVLGGAALS